MDEDGTDKEFRNIGYWNSDAGELTKKERITIETRRKLENKTHCAVYEGAAYVSI